MAVVTLGHLAVPPLASLGLSNSLLRALMLSALSGCDKDLAGSGDTLSLTKGWALFVGPCCHQQGKVMLYKHCLPKSGF